jgi:hypothetical protein
MIEVRDGELLEEIGQSVGDADPVAGDLPRLHRPQATGPDLAGPGMRSTYRQDRFRFGRKADGSPAEPWRWEDLD